MKCFPDVTWGLRIIQIVFIMAVIFINIVIAPYSGYNLPKNGSITNDTKSQPSNHKPQATFEDFYPNYRLNMSKETQDNIYLDIVQTIAHSARTSKKPDTTENIVPNQRVNSVVNESHSKSRSFLSEVIPANYSLRTNVILEPNEISNEILHEHLSANDVGISEKGDFLVGYSSNPFGVSSQYIENMRVEPEYKSQDGQNQTKRKKRSVFHLYNMVLCATGCDPLSYKGYGCYCGFLGSGYVVDGIDSCCKMHDWCYDTAGCPMFLEYFIPYLWKCYHHRPLCAIDHGGYGGPGSCAQRLCECDRQLAQCLRRYPCPSTKAICTSSPWRLLQNIFML